MEQKSKYEMEIENFRKIFDDKKNMRIAIYGIGRRSATLLPGIQDYNVVGLLDRDKNNIGKELCGIKVISLDNITGKADIIIINSDPSNYELIFRRISERVGTPVYYSDGRLAHSDKVDMSYQNNTYWDSTYDDLKEKIDNSQIVSFDIFDTLIMRKIFSPEDVFRLLEYKVMEELNINIDIGEIRAKISAKCNSYASIDDIYDAIQKETGLPGDIIDDIKRIEKDIDMQLCIARNDIAGLYEYCISIGKEVYLISDMYYKLEDIKKLLGKCGLT